MRIPFIVKIGAAILVALILAAAMYVWYARPAFLYGVIQPGQNATSTPHLITPDYTQPISFSADITPEIQKQLNQQLFVAQTEIKTNPLDLKAWLNLGTIYKVGGDYPHAAMAWDFIISVTPSLPAPYFNLGDLYMNFLKDYPKAEQNYTQVIKINTKVVDAYHNLYYLYVDLLKDDAKAKAILDLGLKNNPGNGDLLSLLEEYHKTHVQ